MQNEIELFDLGEVLDLGDKIFSAVETGVQVVNTLFWQKARRSIS